MGEARLPAASDSGAGVGVWKGAVGMCVSVPRVGCVCGRACMLALARRTAGEVKGRVGRWEREGLPTISGRRTLFTTDF